MWRRFKASRVGKSRDSMDPTILYGGQSIDNSPGPGPLIRNDNPPVIATSNTIVNNHYATTKSFVFELDPIQNKISTALRARYVPRAMYDTDRFSGCIDGTRVQVLQDIENWIKNPKGPHIFGLTGVSGIGKSTIARTVCWHADRDPHVLLGGSFFCSRSTGSVAQRDTRYIIPTFAQFLARQSREFRKALSDELDRDPDVLQKNIEAQVEQILYKPLQALDDHRVYIFVIDALDECSGQPTPSEAESHRPSSEILQALAVFSESRFPGTLRVKFLVTSRPETLPRDTLVTNPAVRLYALTKDDVTSDVRLYIDYRLNSHPKLWQITNDDKKALAQISAGLFIVVATALQYALSAGRDTTSRLRALLEAVREDVNTTTVAPLDSTYTFVLKDAMETAVPETDELPKLPELPQLLAVLLSAWSTLSISALAEFLGLSRTVHLRASLSRVAAVINVPERDDEPNLYAIHASFGEYFFDRARNNKSVAESIGHYILARGCLRIMSNRLSQRQSLDKPNSATLDSIQPSVRYACTHWIYHLSQVSTEDRSTLTGDVDEFLAQRLTFWQNVVRLSTGQIDLEVSMLLGTAS